MTCGILCCIPMQMNYNYATYLIMAHAAKSPIVYQNYPIKPETLHGGKAE